MNTKHIVVGLIMLGLTSCDVTDKFPTDSFTDENYWTSTKNLELYANGFLGNLGGANSHLDEQTDVRATVSISDYLAGNSVVPQKDDHWKWENLRSINHFLANYHKVTGDEATINQYVGEVRFFRALDYFDKVKYFGDVPWYNQEMQLSDTALIYKKRDPRALVVDSIVADLEFACQTMATPNKVATGRLHKYVAYQQLARVCLHEGTLEKYSNEERTLNERATILLRKAADAAKYIIDNGGYDIVSMDFYAPQVDESHPLDYAALFSQTEDISSSKECVLARVYAQGLVMNSLSRDMEGPNSGMTKMMVNQYLCTDGKPIGTSDSFHGDNILSEEIQNRDARLYQTIQNEYLPYKYTDGSIMLPNDPPIIASEFPTGFNVMKFHSPDPEQYTLAYSAHVQWFLYRYAEVLLIYAEARTELGELTQTDVDLTINKLRKRAGVAPLDMNNITPTPVQYKMDYGYNLSDLLYEVRRERLVELYAEGFRWDDICRWRAGKLCTSPLSVYGITVSDEARKLYDAVYGTTVSPHIFDIDGGKITTASYNGKRYVKLYQTISDGKGYTWNDKLYLHPLPSEELSLNPNLEQNPGWE